MALYLYQAAYTAESVTAQIKEPQDRIKAVKPALEALGAQIVVGGYPFGEYDLLVISRHLMTPPRPASRWRLPTAVPSGRPRPSGC